MTLVTTDPRAGAARRFLEALTCRTLKALADRRQQRGRHEGARLPASLAGAPSALVELTEDRGGKVPERITPTGYKTARRRLPTVLEALPETDHRRRAAAFLADAIERIDSVKRAQMDGAVSLPGCFSDGGATTRVKRAATLFTLRAVVNGWPYDRERQRFRSGTDRVILSPKYKAAGRRKITAWALATGVAVDGLSFRSVLHNHGWKDHQRERAVLKEATLEILEAIADEFGL